MRVKLEDVCSNQSSNIIQRDIENLVGEYPIFGASGFIKNIDTYKQEQEYLAIVKDGAGVGRVMLLPPKSSVIGTLQYLIPKDNIIPNYLFYVISNMNLGKYANGATIPHIYFKDYKKEEFELPSFDQQQKIVSVLDQVNHLISLRTQQLEQLDLLIKSRFVEMFGDETNSKNLPITDIEKIANVSVGIVVKPSQYYTDENTGIKAFRSLNVDIMNIKDKDWVYLTKEGNELNKKSILHENDVLIVRSGYPGTSCVVTKEYEGCNAIDVIIARPDLSKVNACYLAMYTNLPHGMNQIKRGSGGSAQQHFNVGRYNKLHLILPSIELQNQFAAFVEEVEQSKSTIKQSLSWLNTLKSKLMQDFFG